MFYGVSVYRAGVLRRFDGSGKLKTSTAKIGGKNRELLPYNDASLDNANAGKTPRRSLFLAGDVRANEHAVLTSLHTLFVLEHNRYCDELVKNDAELRGMDEDIYQRARRYVGALMQVITYEEFYSFTAWKKCTKESEI